MSSPMIDWKDNELETTKVCACCGRPFSLQLEPKIAKEIRLCLACFRDFEDITRQSRPSHSRFLNLLSSHQGRSLLDDYATIRQLHDYLSYQHPKSSETDSEASEPAVVEPNEPTGPPEAPKSGCEDNHPPARVSKLSTPPDLPECLCVFGCSVNGRCPLHGDECERYGRRCRCWLSDNTMPDWSCRNCGGFPMCLDCDDKSLLTPKHIFEVHKRQCSGCGLFSSQEPSVVQRKGGLTYCNDCWGEIASPGPVLLDRRDDAPKKVYSAYGALPGPEDSVGRIDGLLGMIRDLADEMDSLVIADWKDEVVSLLIHGSSADCPSIEIAIHRRHKVRVESEYVLTGPWGDTVVENLFEVHQEINRVFSADATDLKDGD